MGETAVLSLIRLTMPRASAKTSLGVSHPPLAANVGDDGGIGDYVTNPKGMHGALSNAPWEELTGRRASSTGTPFSCSIASTRGEDRNAQSWNRAPAP
jgi:hypothetical protein